MGIDNGTVFVYGIQVTLKDLLGENELEKDIFEYLDNFKDTFKTSEHSYNLQVIQASPYYDCDLSECIFLFGVNFDDDVDLEHMTQILKDSSEINIHISQFCDKLNLQKTPSFIVKPNIY